MTELEEIKEFIQADKALDSIPTMEQELQAAIGYGQRVGEMLNQAEYDYQEAFAVSLEKLSNAEDETETTRKAKLQNWTKDHKKAVQDLKLMKDSLRSVRMALMQATKTRREEMGMR